MAKTQRALEKPVLQTKVSPQNKKLNFFKHIQEPKAEMLKIAKEEVPLKLESAKMFDSINPEEANQTA